MVWNGPIASLQENSFGAQRAVDWQQLKSSWSLESYETPSFRCISHGFEGPKWANWPISLFPGTTWPRLIPSAITSCASRDKAPKDIPPVTKRLQMETASSWHRSPLSEFPRDPRGLGLPLASHGISVVCSPTCRFILTRPRYSSERAPLSWTGISAQVRAFVRAFFP